MTEVRGPLHLIEMVEAAEALGDDQNVANVVRKELLKRKDGVLVAVLINLDCAVR